TSTDYRVNVWVELHNPFPAELATNDPAGGKAILQTAAGGSAIYRMLLCRGPVANIRGPDNVDGREATAANIAGTLVDWGAPREVKPGFGLYNDATATNNGFYVVAPKWTYPANGTAADPFGVALTPSLSSDQMTYSLLQANDPTIAPAAGGT